MTHDVEDGSQVEALLDQIPGPLASFTGDGAYDQADIYGTVCKHHPDADVIVPQRSTAVPSEIAKSTPTQPSPSLSEPIETLCSYSAEQPFVCHVEESKRGSLR